MKQFQRPVWSNWAGFGQIMTIYGWRRTTAQGSWHEGRIIIEREGIYEYMKPDTLNIQLDRVD